jgi:hypothetical protein
MLESLIAALGGAITTAKAMASFDAFRKGRKGDARALIEELKENSRLCFHVANDGVELSRVIPKFSTIEFDRLNKAGFDFNALKRGKIPEFSGIAQTDLTSWPGKTTGQLVNSIYEKIKNVRSIYEFKPESATLRRRLLNIHKRILLLLRHAEA